MPDLKALKNSVLEHWERNLRAAKEGDYDELRIGTSACAFCEEFLAYRDIENRCMGCPIMAASGSMYCWATPYVGVMTSLREVRWGLDNGAYVPDGRLVDAIERELKFLEDLDV